MCVITSGGDDDDMMTLRRLPLPDFIRCLSACQGNQAVKRGANLGTPPQNAVSHSLTQSTARFTLLLSPSPNGFSVDVRFLYLLVIHGPFLPISTHCMDVLCHGI